MAAIDVVYGESGFNRLLPLTVADGATLITGLGTLIDFNNAVKVAPSHAGYAGSASKTKYFTTKIHNGNDFSIVDNSKSYDPTTGLVVDTSGSTSNTSKHSCSVTYTPAQRNALITLNLNGKPVISIRETGIDAATGLVAGYEYLIGTVQNLKENNAAGVSTLDYDVVGCVIGPNGSFQLDCATSTPWASLVTFATINTAAAGGSHTITLVNGTVRTITSLVTGDFGVYHGYNAGTTDPSPTYTPGDLLKGLIVTK